MMHGSSGPSTIMLDIVMFHRPLFSGPVRRFSARTGLGEIGILPRHAPLMALLLPCVARIQVEDGMPPRLIYIGGGFIEVQPAHITVLAEDALWADEVDVHAARQALGKAEQQMRSSVLIQDREKAQLEWLQASAQIELWEKGRSVEAL